MPQNRTRRLFALVVALLVLGAQAAPAAAQNAPVYRNSAGTPEGARGVFIMPAPVGGAGQAVTSTVTSSTVAVASTFQSALAASTSRRGCLLVNTSTATEYVFLGAPGSASVAASIPILAGQTLNCTVGTTVIGDQLSITSATVDAPYVVISQ